MSKGISSRTPLEYVTGRGFHQTETSRRGRAILPSFSDQFGGATMSVIATENVSVNVSIPSLAAGASTTVSQRQGLQAIPAVNPSTTDIGQAIFSNVSVAPPDNIMPGHPTIQVITQQGAPAAGLLQPGLPYTNLALNVDLTVFAMTVFAGGSATVSATVLLLGTASGNQA